MSKQPEVEKSELGPLTLEDAKPYTPEERAVILKFSLAGAHRNGCCRDSLRFEATIRSLTEHLRRAKAEVAVRSYNYGFVSIPPEFRKQGRMAAFDAGYESGWRNWNRSNLYTRSDCREAWEAGRKLGAEHSAEEIEFYLQQN